MLTKWTKAKIDELSKVCNHTVNINDFDYILELNEADKRVMDPRTTENASLLSRPIYFGDTPIYPLTLGIAEWLAILSDWYKDDQDTLGLAMIYVLTQEDILSELEKVKRPWVFKIELKNWARKSKLTIAQMQEIMDLRYPELAKSNGDKDEDNGPLVAMLVKEYGQDIDYWLNAPVDHLNIVISDYNSRQQQAADQARAQGSTVLPLPSPKNLAIRKRLEVVNKIREAWSK